MHDFFFLRVINKNVKVNFGDILYVESSKNYMHIYTTHGDYTQLMTMLQLEKLLPACTFCRVHKSFIVSLNHLTAFDSYHVYFGNKLVPIGMKFRNALAKRVVIAQTHGRRPAIALDHLEIVESQN